MTVYFDFVRLLLGDPLFAMIEASNKHARDCDVGRIIWTSRRDIPSGTAQMNAADLIRRLHQHRAWVNRNLLSTAATLTDEQLKTPLAIGQGSVWKSLTHLQAAEYVWLGSLMGDENPIMPGDVPGHLPGNQLGEGGFKDLADLTAKWSELEQRWTVYLNSLRPESLDDTVYKVSTSTGKGVRFGCRRSDILLHICTHAQYTVAQVVNMFRQLGVEKFPDTMLIAMARLESQ